MGPVERILRLTIQIWDASGKLNAAEIIAPLQEERGQLRRGLSFKV